MAIREVIRMGHPVLRQKAQELTLEEINSPEIQKLIRDMRETMKDQGGIGIAAPQVGVSKQLALIEIQDDNRRYSDNRKTPLQVFINPKVMVLDHTVQGYWEGCLSVPGLRGFVERPRKIRIQFLDETAQKREIEVEGFLATVYQHELDHLEGILYVDRIKDLRLLSFEEEFERFWAKQGESLPLD